MRILNRRTIEEYGRKYGPDAQSGLRAWFHEANAARWASPQDIRNRYHTADFVKEAVVFDICNNRFRLIVKIWFPGQEVYIKFFGTHAEYDDIDIERL